MFLSTFHLGCPFICSMFAPCHPGVLGLQCENLRFIFAGGVARVPAPQGSPGLWEKPVVTEVVQPAAFRAAQLTSSSRSEKMSLFGEDVPVLPGSVCLWGRQKGRAFVRCSAFSSLPIRPQESCRGYLLS